MLTGNLIRVKLFPIDSSSNRKNQSLQGFMSIRIVSQVWDKAPYTEGTMLTLLALADWANDEGVCWPKMQMIAQKSRLSFSGAQFAMRKLLQDGAVSVSKESRGPGRSRTYQIGAQYLSPLEKKGLSNPKKGLSNQRRNKEEPSLEATVKIYCEKCNDSGIRSSYFKPNIKVACECQGII